MIEIGVSFVLFDYSSGNSLHVKQRILLLIGQAIVACGKGAVALNGSASALRLMVEAVEISY